MNRHAVGLAGCVGVLATFGARPAAADGLVCSRVAVDAGFSVNARWPGLVEQVQRALAGRDDVDLCAHVVLGSRGTTLTLQVALADGRSATRSALHPEDVVPTLEALLLVPEAPVALRQVEAREARPATPPQERPTSPPVPSGAVAPPPESAASLPLVTAARAPNPDAGPSSRGSSHVRIELSALTGARVGDGQWGVGGGALSFLDVSGWLVGFAGRVDRYRTIAPGGTDGAALELAPLFGRRLRERNVSFDLFMGPAAADQGAASYTSTSPAPPSPRPGPSMGQTISASSTSIAPRLLVGARVNFGALSVLRTFVGVDGDFGAARTGGDVPGGARLPVWTLGLAVGATVGTR